jgi:hypothetical protein
MAFWRKFLKNIPKIIRCNSFHLKELKMSTLLQLVNEVLRRTGQRVMITLTNSDTPSSQTFDFLNEIYFEILQALELNRLEKRDLLITSLGVANYSLADDATIGTLLTDSLIHSDNELRLREVSGSYPLEQGLTVVGKPTCFYREGNSVYLYPTPDATYSIQYKYLITPQKLSGDSTQTQLPVEWERVLIRGTQALLEHFLGDVEQNNSYVLYQQGLSQLKKQCLIHPYDRMFGFYRGYYPI